MAAPAAAANDPSRDQLLWAEELARLRVSAPSLPESARQLISAVLESIVGESGEDPYVTESAHLLFAELGQQAGDAADDLDPHRSRSPWQRRARSGRSPAGRIAAT